MPANQPIPQPLLEVLALGEPNAPTIADLARRAGVDEVEVRRLVARIEDSNRQILETYPPNVVAAGIRARLDSQPGVPRRRSWFVMPAVACVLATVVLGALWVLHPVQLPRLDEGLRVKGATRLVLYRQTTGQPELLHDGSTARAGDVLQLGYIAAGARHGVLLSVDGVGKVTLHFPSTPTEDTSLRAGTTLLPFSFRLDEAPASNASF